MTQPPAKSNDSGAGSPSQGAEASPNPDDPKQSRNDKSPLWISIAGWIVTLLIAVAANATTIFVANNGQTNASIQSANEFRRGQQQTQYIDFVNAASAFSDAAFMHQSAVFSGINARKIDDNVVEPLRKDAETRLHTLRTKLAAVKLVGSPDAASAALAVVNSGTNVYNHATKQGLNLKKAEPVDPLTLEFSDKLGASIKHFVETARSDLDATARP